MSESHILCNSDLYFWPAGFPNALVSGAHFQGRRSLYMVEGRNLHPQLHYSATSPSHLYLGHIQICTSQAYCIIIKAILTSLLFLSQWLLSLWILGKAVPDFLAVFAGHYHCKQHPERTNVCVTPRPAWSATGAHRKNRPDPIQGHSIAGLHYKVKEACKCPSEPTLPAVFPTFWFAISLQYMLWAYRNACPFPYIVTGSTIHAWAYLNACKALIHESWPVLGVRVLSEKSIRWAGRAAMPETGSSV